MKQYFAAPLIGGPFDGLVEIHDQPRLLVWECIVRPDGGPLMIRGEYVWRWNYPLPDGSTANRWVWIGLSG